MQLSKQRLQQIILEEVVNHKRISEGDDHSRMITQVETIGDTAEEAAGMSDNPEVVERLERVDQMVTALLQQLQDVTPADSDGYSKVPGTRPMQEGLHYEGLMEIMVDALRNELGSWQPEAKAEAYDELASKGLDLTKVALNILDDEAGRNPGGSIGEANEGGEGVHDIMNLPEPDAVEPSGNPKEDALRNIVAQGQRAKVDGQMMDLFSASAVVQVLDALSPKNKEHYLGMPPLKMAEIAFKLAK